MGEAKTELTRQMTKEWKIVLQRNEEVGNEIHTQETEQRVVEAGFETEPVFFGLLTRRFRVMRKEVRTKTSYKKSPDVFEYSEWQSTDGPAFRAEPRARRSEERSPLSVGEADGNQEDGHSMRRALSLRFASGHCSRERCPCALL